VISKVEATLPNRYHGVAVPLRLAFRTKIERATKRSGEILEDFAGDTRRKPLRGEICTMDKILIDERYELWDMAGSGGMGEVYLASIGKSRSSCSRPATRVTRSSWSASGTRPVVPRLSTTRT
jgi:hypothetical protein